MTFFLLLLFFGLSVHANRITLPAKGAEKATCSFSSSVDLSKLKFSKEVSDGGDDINIDVAVFKKTADFYSNSQYMVTNDGVGKICYRQDVGYGMEYDKICFCDDSNPGHLYTDPTLFKGYTFSVSVGSKQSRIPFQETQIETHAPQFMVVMVNCDEKGRSVMIDGSVLCKTLRGGGGGGGSSGTGHVVGTAAVFLFVFVRIMLRRSLRGGNAAYAPTSTQSSDGAAVEMGTMS